MKPIFNSINDIETYIITRMENRYNKFKDLCQDEWDIQLYLEHERSIILDTVIKSIQKKGWNWFLNNVDLHEFIELVYERKIIHWNPLEESKRSRIKFYIDSKYSYVMMYKTLPLRMIEYNKVFKFITIKKLEQKYESNFLQEPQLYKIIASFIDTKYIE